MIKNILIISSEFTGHGHKSITEALCEKFAQYKNVNVHVVDGFSLGGKTLLKIGKSYGPITRNAESLWQLVWNISSIKPLLVDEVIELKIEHNFIELLDEVKPDLILSVHANFNGSIINILQKHNINIPFITFIADLVSIYPLWSDPRADYIISPTIEGKEKCIEYGVPAEKVKILGFPVRSRFCKQTNEVQASDKYDTDKPLKCLIMSGGEGVGNMNKIAKNLLDNFNCTIKIVAGRNIAMKRRLEQSLCKVYGNRVEIYGFTQNIQDLMFSSDIAFTRASPNVMMEAIACNIPLVLTGALPGQEEGNPKFAEKYKLGVCCSDAKNIKDVISDLLANNAQKLNDIKISQKKYRNINAAKDIVDFILDLNYEDKENAFYYENHNIMGVQ